MTEKIYCDVEGIERTLEQMVRIEPEWAASRIRAGEEAIAERDDLRTLLAAARAHMLGDGHGYDSEIITAIDTALKEPKP